MPRGGNHLKTYLKDFKQSGSYRRWRQRLGGGLMRKTKPLKIFVDFMNCLYQKGLTDQFIVTTPVIDLELSKVSKKLPHKVSL